MRGPLSGRRGKLTRRDPAPTLLGTDRPTEALSARIIGAGAIGTISTDLWGDVVHWSSEAQAMFGWSSNDAVGKHLDRLLSPVVPEGRPSGTQARKADRQLEDVPGIFEVLSAGPSWSGTLAETRLRGGVAPRMLAASPLKSTRGTVIGHVVICIEDAAPDSVDSPGTDAPATRVSHDCTHATHTVNQESHSAEQIFRQVFSENPVGTALVGTDARILDVNAALCRSLGFSHEELVGKSFVRVQSS